MSGDDLVRSWKDPDHRADDVEHPSGDIALGQAFGGGAARILDTGYAFSTGCPPCGGFTSPTCLLCGPPPSPTAYNSCGGNCTGGFGCTQGC